MKKSTRLSWQKAYKEYYLEYGELVPSVKMLSSYRNLPFIQFGQYYETLLEVEVDLIAAYFLTAMKTIQKDKNFDALEKKEQHLTFLYLLIEAVSKDELFLRAFQRQRTMDASFGIQLQLKLREVQLSWAQMSEWRPDFIDDLNLNPKQGVAMTHALSCISFFLKDKSKDKQDTDAYIEKTTDLLFKLSDTSTLHSVLDLGKFMFSRAKSSFNA